MRQTKMFWNIFQGNNFLQFDALNVLIVLIASYPGLTYPHVAARPNIGEMDTHILHLCTVLHLLQVEKFSIVSSVTRLGVLLDFGQLLKAFGSN